MQAGEPVLPPIVGPVRTHDGCAQCAAASSERLYLEHPQRHALGRLTELVEDRSGDHPTANERDVNRSHRLTVPHDNATTDGLGAHLSVLSRDKAALLHFDAVLTRAKPIDDIASALVGFHQPRHNRLAMDQDESPGDGQAIRGRDAPVD